MSMMMADVRLSNYRAYSINIHIQCSRVSAMRAKWVRSARIKKRRNGYSVVYIGKFTYVRTYINPVLAQSSVYTKFKHSPV